MVMLTDISNGGIVANLKKRYEKDIIYVRYFLKGTIPWIFLASDSRETDFCKSQIESFSLILILGCFSSFRLTSVTY
jgi:hypothetical protein